MKRTNQYFAIVIALALAASCTNLIEEVTPSGSGLISFSPKSVATKAMVDSVNLADQVFDVRDVLTVNNSSTLHLENYIAYSDGKWSYQATPDSYYWLDGDHKFFGYTHGLEDATLGSDWKLGIDERTITTDDEDQVDILYSDIYKTSAASWKGSHTATDSVKLQFHHLLSAVSFSLVNYTGAALTVESATVTLPNKASATVDFSGDAVAATVDVDSETIGSFGGFTAQTTVPDKDTVDILTGAAIETPEGATERAKATPFMIWPQTLGEDAATVSIVVGNKTKSVSIAADTEWEAGKVYAYVIMVYPDEVILQFEVQDWQKESFEFTTMANASINMTNVSWMNTKVTVDGQETNTVVNGAYSVYMYYHPTVNGQEYTATNGYYPAQGFFTVNYPESGVFKIGLIPAYGETTVDPSKYEIYIYDPDVTGHWRAQNTDGETISRNTVYFQVRAASGQDGALHKAQVDIWFKATDTDEWISAYSEVRANYALIIPATN